MCQSNSNSNPNALYKLTVTEQCSWSDSSKVLLFYRQSSWWMMRPWEKRAEAQNGQLINIKVFINASWYVLLHHHYIVAKMAVSPMFHKKHFPTQSDCEHHVTEIKYWGYQSAWMNVKPRWRHSILQAVCTFSIARYPM